LLFCNYRDKKCTPGAIHHCLRVEGLGSDFEYNKEHLQSGNKVPVAGE
jgi:hypothetical protein